MRDIRELLIWGALFYIIATLVVHTLCILVLVFTRAITATREQLHNNSKKGN